MVKRLLVLLSLVLPLVFAQSASASFISVIDFEGFFTYSGSGDLDPQEEICESGFANQLLCDSGSSEDGWYGVGALRYEADLNFPPPDQEVPWWLEIDLYIDGETEDVDLPFPLPFELEDEMIDIGTFPIGLTEEEIGSFLTGIPGEGEFGPIAYLFSGDAESGEFLFAIEENILDFDEEQALYLEFEGQLTLTAHVDREDPAAVPEPATMILFGAGMAGSALARRKKSV